MSPQAYWRARLASRLCQLEWYVAIALFLPGGSLLPFAIWAFRHRAWVIARARRLLAAVRATA